MDSNIQNAAAGLIAPKLVSSFRFRWLAYGAAAYYGLKFMNKRGILPKQTTAALNVIDRGIDLAKQQIGFGKWNRTSADRSGKTVDVSTGQQLSH